MFSQEQKTEREKDGERDKIEKHDGVQGLWVYTPSPMTLHLHLPGFATPTGLSTLLSSPASLVQRKALRRKSCEHVDGYAS